MNLSKEQEPIETMSNVPVNEGQALIVEMLDYGKRLYLASNEEEGGTV